MNEQEVKAWVDSQPKCGCGRIARYQTSSGLACNKHMRCDNAEFLSEQNDQLRAKLAEAERQRDALAGDLYVTRQMLQSLWIDADQSTWDSCAAAQIEAEIAKLEGSE